MLKKLILSAFNKKEIAFDSENTEVEYFIKQLIYEGFGSVLYKNRLPQIDLPKDALNLLRNAYYSNLAKNVQFQEKAKQVISILKEAEIEVVLLKGIAMVSYYYDDIALRPMSDIDLLIKEADIERAEEVLLKNGLVNTNKQRKFIKNLRLGHNLPLEFNNTLIELHWRVLNSANIYQVSIDEFWNRAKLIDFAGIGVKIFSAENQIQHIAVHINSHLSKSHVRINWWYDALLIIEKDRIDWKYLESCSIKFNIILPVQELLWVLKEQFGTNIPDWFFETMTIEHKNNSLQIFELLINGKSHLIKKSSHLSYLKKIGAIKGKRNKLRYLLSEAFPPKDHIIQNNPHLRNKPMPYIYIANFYLLTRKVLINIFKS